MYLNCILLDRKKKKYWLPALIVLLLPFPIIFTLMITFIAYQPLFIVVSILLITIFLFSAKNLMNYKTPIGWEYLDDMEIFRGHVHLAPYTMDRSVQVHEHPSIWYRNVLFLAKNSHEASSFGYFSAPDTFIPKLTRSVKADEVHVDCRNRIMYINPKTYHSMNVYTIYEPLCISR